jgi:hypothetical protein
MAKGRSSVVIGLALLAVWCPIDSQSRVLADAISPHIRETTSLFPPEKPNTAFYGSGVAGRMTEASELRFAGERDTMDGKFDDAIHKLAKAVQMDPGDPAGHLLFARALSRKISAGKHVTPQLVQVALSEWKQLWHHDADQTEQLEAQLEARRLGRVARTLSKQLREKRNSGSEPKELVAEKAEQTN